MTEVPADVRERLLDRLDDAQKQVRAGDAETAKETVRLIAGVASEEVPAQELSAQLLHGCEEVEYHAADDPGVAVEYLRAMRDRAAEAEVSE